MPYTPVILTSLEDYEAVRAYAGVQNSPNSPDFSDDRVKSSPFLAQAEIFVMNEIAKQAVNGVPTLVQLLAGTGGGAVANDAWKVKNAVIYYIVKLFTAGETNAVNVSVTQSKITVDRGGLGTQWVDQEKRAEAEASRALRLITNWKRWRTL